MPGGSNAGPGTGGRPSATPSPTHGAPNATPSRPDHQPNGNSTFTPRPAADRPDPRAAFGQRPSNPDNTRPGTPGPTTPRPDSTRPDGARPDGARPDGTRPDSGRPDGTRADGARPDGTRPDGTRPDGGRPDGTRPDGTRADGARPDGTRPDGTRPDGARPDGAHPDGARPDGARPEGAHSDGTHSDAPGGDSGRADGSRGDDHPAPADAERSHDGDQQGPSESHDAGGDDHRSGDSRQPLAESRPYDTPGGLERPDPQHQSDLESRVPRNADGSPQRHPDPNGDWPGAVNGDGHRAPGRDNNCLDVALSTADTYSGNPTAAAPRSEAGPDGEAGGRDRAERQLGAPFRDMGNGDPAFRRIEDQLRDAGHGSQAVIITQDANGRAHAWNVVNHDGKITYLDNQTGQRSDKPLHDGEHGVFAIPLDGDRRPLPSDGAPDHRPDQSERRPEDPAGKKHGLNESDDEANGGSSSKKPKKDDSDTEMDSDSDSDSEPKKTDKEVIEERRANDPDHPIHEDSRTDHERLPDREDRTDEILGVAPDAHQADLRDSNEVRQVDMDHVYDSLHGWAENGQLGDVLDRSKAGNPTTFNRAQLETALPGFSDMHPGEQGAVVAAMGRMSHEFHMNHGVGASPEAMAHPYHNPPTEPGTAPGEADTESRGGVDHAKSKGTEALKAAEDHDEVKDAIKEAFDRKSISAAVTKDAEHRPDFTGRNYAVIEVYDPKTNEVSFVVDSSVPPSKARAGISPLHSETHLGGWMENLKSTREQADQPEVLSLYTEREPCGIGAGHADCSGYLSRDHEGVPVYYATGYRKGDGSDVADPSTGLTPKQQMDQDFGNHVSEVGRIWLEMEQH
ncbi:toxin glutamine deamidase domain-containing protein [Streptomyces sp. TLI_171]|uniref:toxin glutamine deamidase domain-containing protein n=1 Tax=Streptomyces sp. TLI_171 TaxID=1938859 RepID=UPI000C4B91D5|nr:toxin glutamine deamidase domain-containing protein [Streptomyces sp. TLI_171]RKE23290.1 papain fold toxin 1 (glutamine deamidase) of polymorphic toxin system [Streptomyces sp. TLI_171]